LFQLYKFNTFFLLKNQKTPQQKTYIVKIIKTPTKTRLFCLSIFNFYYTYNLSVWVMYSKKAVMNS